jgi:hypothetical protein
MNVHLAYNSNLNQRPDYCEGRLSHLAFHCPWENSSGNAGEDLHRVNTDTSEETAGIGKEYYCRIFERSLDL